MSSQSYQTLIFLNLQILATNLENLQQLKSVYFETAKLSGKNGKFMQYMHLYAIYAFMHSKKFGMIGSQS
jgi:hypothetical protein